MPVPHTNVDPPTSYVPSNLTPIGFLPQSCNTSAHLSASNHLPSVSAQPSATSSITPTSKRLAPLFSGTILAPSPSFTYSNTSILLAKLLLRRQLADFFDAKTELIMITKTTLGFVTHLLVPINSHLSP